MAIADLPRASFATMLALALVILHTRAPERVLGPGWEESTESDEGTGVVERIVIRGNTRTRDKVIRRELGITETEPVDMFELGGAPRRLRALGYFLVAAVSVRPGSMRGLVTIEVDVVEAPRVSAGFTSAENFIAICAIRQN